MDLLEEMNPDKKQIIIFECEFLAVFTAMLIWGNEFGPSAVLYTDSDAVRDSLISCNISNAVAKADLGGEVDFSI